jgi:hypothetical protein
VVKERKKLKINVEPDAVNERFLPYLCSKARYRLFWGGRSSSKSDMACLDHLLQCLTLPYFKCIMVRKVADTIQGSLWATLKAVAEREGIDHLFFWGTSPLVVRCLINGNSFIARGLDNPRKIKSVREPTHALYEEANEISKNDFDVVSTTLRCSQPDAVIQETFLFNPDQSGDYKEFFLWKMFFEATGYPNETSFSGLLQTEIEGELVSQAYEVMHSTIRDNRWASREDVARYKRYGDISPVTGEMFDEYLYTIWYLGLWATRKTGNEFYHNFREHAHASTATPFLLGQNILQSWDANSLPYCAMFCAQTQQKPGGGRILRIFKEYALRSPNSGITPTGRQFLKDRAATPEWQQVEVYLTGDASMRNAKIGEERTASTFKDVQAALSGFTDADKKVVRGCLNSRSDALWPRSNPGVDRRRDFINDLLSGLIPNTTIQIDPSCKNLINDLKQVQKGVDGKLKPRVLDKELNATYEPIGHFSDILDYYVTSVLKAEYEAFKATK